MAPGTEIRINGKHSWTRQKDFGFVLEKYALNVRLRSIFA